MLLTASSLQKSVLNLNPLLLLPLEKPLSGGRYLYLCLLHHEGRQRTAEDGDGHDHSDVAGPDDMINVNGEGDNDKQTHQSISNQFFLDICGFNYKSYSKIFKRM